MCGCECELTERKNEVFKILHSIEAIELGTMLNLIHGIQREKEEKRNL